MEEFQCIGTKGYYGMLVFVRKIKNIIYDDERSSEQYEYEDRLEPGFILEVSEYFENYYLVRYFTGDRVFHWGDDLFKRKEENDLTYLER